MSEISQYLSDHTNAGACAANYYDNTHDPVTCRVAPGVCSVIAYLVMELKNAEMKVKAAEQYPSVQQPLPQYIPAPVPFVPTAPAGPGPLPRVTSDSFGGTVQGSGGPAGWSGEAEQR